MTGESVLDRRVAATAAVIFFLLVATAELVSRGLSATGALYGRISLSGMLTSLPAGCFGGTGPRRASLQ